MRKRKWIDSFIAEDKDFLIEDAKQYDNIYLEIGMGMGDFISQSAFQHPENFYVGIEKNASCVARAIRKGQELELKNLKIIFRDAFNIPDLFNKNSVSCIYLHFSDPWPKKGHHKRRLTYNTFLDKYYELLKDDGCIIFKTDNDDLYSDSLEYFAASKFEVTDKNFDYHSIVRHEPLTGYEAKFKELGQPIHYAKLVKKQGL